MKRIISIFMLIIAVIGGASFNSYASVKDDIKSAKKQAKEYKKDNWKTESSTTIENGLVRIAEKKNDGYKELIGVSLGSKKSNVAKTKARNNAINEFAEYGKSIVKARINTKVDDINEEEVDNLVTGYERMVVRELENAISMPELILRRDNNGTYDYMLFYLIDERTADKIQKKAFDEALEESGMAAKYGDDISDFIKKGF